jgi:hypothetical protein
MKDSVEDLAARRRDPESGWGGLHRLILEYVGGGSVIYGR